MLLEAYKTKQGKFLHKNDLDTDGEPIAHVLVRVADWSEFDDALFELMDFDTNPDNIEMRICFLDEAEIGIKKAEKRMLNLFMCDVWGN